MEYRLKNEDMGFWLNDVSDDCEITPVESGRSQQDDFTVFGERINLFRILFEMFVKLNELQSEAECISGELDELFEEQVFSLSRI